MKTCFFVSAVAAIIALVRAETVPLDLRCDGIGEALAASAAPLLSWRVESEDRGQSQSAWQILVSSKAELLAEDRGDLWDSGKTAAGRTPFTSYAGSALAPGGRYYWKVRCWDAGDQPGAWSKPAVMEIAPLAPGDWQGAQWIDDGRPLPSRDEDFYQPSPAPLLRREFTLGKPVLRVPVGTRITLRYGELLNPDGSLNPLTSVCGQIKGARKAPDEKEVLIDEQLPLAIRWLDGIQAADDAVGFDRILIPPDATVIIELPAVDGKELTESGRPVSEAPGVTALPPGPRVHRLKVGSGRYRFSTRGDNASR